MYEKKNDINSRVFFVGGGMIILSSFLLSRLWKLQVSEQDKYLLLSDKNRIRITPLFPKIEIAAIDYQIIGGNSDNIIDAGESLNLSTILLNDFEWYQR